MSESAMVAHTPCMDEFIMRTLHHGLIYPKRRMPGLSVGQPRHSFPAGSYDHPVPAAHLAHVQLPVGPVQYLLQGGLEVVFLDADGDGDGKVVLPEA